jgi:biopolymer transport protein ExbD
MRKKREYIQSEEENEINMTPMLDVVFIMLIFFIVTTSFVKESGVSVNRPTAQSAKTVQKGNIIVAIKPDGEIWIDKRAIDLRAVKANIQRLHAQNPQSAVVIVSDREAKTGILVKVMDQIRQAGVQNVSIAAEVNR